MEKLKKIAKYTTNILGIIAMLITGINQVDGLNIPYAPQIIGVIAVVQGVIGTYLLGNKTISNKKEFVNETSDNKGDEEDE